MKKYSFFNRNRWFVLALLIFSMAMSTHQISDKVNIHNLAQQNSNIQSYLNSNESGVDSDLKSIAQTNAEQNDKIKANYTSWGLGTTFVQYNGNNKPYPWYVDQAHTGKRSGDNCGPSCVELAGTWCDSTFEMTTEDIRKKLHPSGGWWTTEDLMQALESYKIEYNCIDFENSYSVTNAIDAEKIIIICTDMSQISYESSSNTRVNRFYDGVTGHFLIIKGYVRVDTNLYYEVYDPNNWDVFYTDGTPKGVDRYYEANAVNSSILSWYPKLIIINKRVH